MAGWLRAARRVRTRGGAQAGPYFDLNRKALQEDVMDIEDLTKLATSLGEREQPCPYFLARSMAEVRPPATVTTGGAAACGSPAQLARARGKINLRESPLLSRREAVSTCVSEQKRVRPLVSA
jgi:hypothetical protein